MCEAFVLAAAGCPAVLLMSHDTLTHALSVCVCMVASGGVCECVKLPYLQQGARLCC